MGRCKFYKAPVGKIRVEALIRSGVHFDVDSVEFRLINLHTVVERRFTTTLEVQKYKQWNLLMHTCAYSNKIDDAQLKKTLRVVSDDFKDILHTYSDPTALFLDTKSNTEKNRKEEEQAKLNYMDQLAAKPFSDLSQILNKVKALNSQSQK